MIEYINYLWEVSLGISLFYGVYLLLFRKDTGFQLRRLFLLTTLVLPFLIPFLDFSFEESIPITTDIRLISSSPSSFQLENTTETTSHFLPWSWVFGLLVFGTSLMCLRFGYILFQVAILIHSAEILKQGAHTIAFSSKIEVPFSFLPFIFLPKKYKKYPLEPAILLHEQAHIKQYHTLDLLCAEIVLCILWFNPLIWLLQKSLKEVHEYLADELILKHGIDKREYQFLILKQSVSEKSLSLVHSFHFLPIKKRIMMMNKQRSPFKSRLKIATSLPLAMICLLAMTAQGTPPANSFDESPDAILIEGKVLSLADRNPLIGAAILIKNSSTGTITNQKGEFRIQIPKNSSLTLTVSFIGFKSYEVPLTESGKIMVFLGKNDIKGTHDFTPQAIDLTQFEKDQTAEKEKMSMELFGTKKASPLFVLDGKIVETGMADIEPNDIESLEVLKDEAAIKKYGDKGKNGVIEITTKQK